MRLKIQVESGWKRRLTPNDRRFWLLWAVGFRIHVRTEPLWEFVIYWKRLLAIMATLAVVAYFSLVTVIHWRWRQLPENRVRWVDLALAPVRWGELRHKRGETAIATGLRELERGKIGPAVFNLRAGLARAPGDVRARLALSEVYSFGGDSSEAVKLIEQGLVHAPDSEELIGRLFIYFSNLGAWTRLLAFADELLAADRQPPLPPALRERTVHQRIAGLIELGRPAQALAALDAEPALPDGPAARERLALRLTTLERLGRLDEARALYLASGGAERARRGDPGVELRSARVVGDTGAIETALRQLRAARPDSIEPYLVALRVWNELGRVTFEDAVLRDIFSLFRRDDQAFHRFAKLLVELERRQLLERLRRAAVQERMNPFAYDVGLTEIMLRHGQWDEAAQHVTTWEAHIGALPEAQRAYPELVRRLVRAATVGGSGDVAALLTQLETHRGRFGPKVFVQTGRVLEAAARGPAALEVARLGARRFEWNDDLRVVEARLAAQEAARPSVAAAPVAARRETGTAEFEAAVREIDAALAAGRLDSAASTLRSWKAAMPTPSRDEEHALALREVRLTALRQDAPAARFVIRRFLDRFPATEDALLLLALARELKQGGAPTAAEIIQTEVATARLSQPEVAAALAEQGLSGDNSALVSAAEARRAIDEAFARGDYAKVPQVVRLVRRAAPDWLADLAPELALAEVRARALTKELPAATIALREVVLRTGPVRARLWATIRLVAREGQPDAARVLAEEAVRLLPGDNDAKALLAELTANPAGDAPR